MDENKPTSKKGASAQHSYKTKEDRHEELLARLDAELPSADVGQFAGVESIHVDVFTEHLRALRVAERMMRGTELRDACLIESAPYHSYRKALRCYRNAQREPDELTDAAELANTWTWTYALGYTLERATAVCRDRWQKIAEAGGKGAKSAMWMLERRGGRTYLPPVRREQVTSTTTTNSTTTTLTLEAKLEATRASLGFSDEHLAQMGEWLAKAQTSAQRGEALPPPPTQQELPLEQGAVEQGTQQGAVEQGEPVTVIDVDSE